MSLAAGSVRRPVTTAMVTMIVVLIGAVALSRLPIDLLPDVTMPTISVVTNYENASPEEVEQQITEEAERALAAVPGVESMISTSSEGSSSVRLSFTWGTNLDAASNDVRDRIDRIRRRLPAEADLPQPRKFDPANFPIVLLGVASQLDPIELTDLIESRITTRLGRLDGVAQVDVWGGFHREIQVRLDRGRINALDLSLDTVVDTIRAANVNVPAGSVDRDRLEVTLRTPGEFRDLDELRQTVIVRHQGAPVLLGDIGEVVDTHRKITRIVRINGEPGVRLAVRKQSGVNTVAVAERVVREIEAMNADLRQAEVTTLFNQAAFIRRSIDNVTNSVLLGGALAILVLLFFLRNLRSTVVIGLAIPISVIATFALIHFAGFSLNLMTLGGLALGVGMMVDNSIVVLENIFRRRRELGEAAESSAVNGASEVAAAIIASTITTLVIFLPLVFSRGVSSILFQQLAAVIAFALVCSLLVSLSLVPMLASKLLTGDGETRGPRWLRRCSAIAEGVFAAMDRSYRDVLTLVLRHRLITVAAALLLLVASLPLVRGIGSEFMPPSDEGEIRVSGEMEVGTRLQVLDQQTRILEELIREHVPELVDMSVSAGPSGWRPSSSAEASIQISVGPAASRQRSNTAIAASLRQAIDGQVPGMTVRVRAPQGLRILNRLVGSGDEGLAVEIYGFDLDILDDLAETVAAALSTIPGITDAIASREVGVPQELLRIDRHRAHDLGLSVRQIAGAVETAVAGTQAGDYRDGGDAIRILVRLSDADTLTSDQLLDLRVGNGGDSAGVPLRSVVEIEASTGPMLIERKDQQRFVSVAANVAGRDMGSIAADVQLALDEIPLPVGYSFVIAGDYQEQQEAFYELMLALVLSLLLVYMVLASQYESFRDPLVVMFAVPLAAIGVLLTLFLTGTTFNVQSYIGCIMLGGIVVNNAILLVDQAGRLRREGLDTQAAVAEAGRRRLRPILMTTLTTILGLLPLALGVGEGAEAQAPLARAVIGGLATSTLITLVLIPALYSLVHARDRKVNAVPEPAGSGDTQPE